MRHTISRIAFAGAVAAFGTGCEHSPDIATRMIAYNEAVAESTNQVLLLNVLRASQRLPMQFTRTTGNTTTTFANPALSLAIPFNDPSTTTGTLSLGTSSQNQVGLENNDDKDFVNGMMTPVTPETYRFFADSGWSNELLLLTFVNSIDIPATALNPLWSAAWTNCRQRMDDKMCRALFDGGELSAAEAPAMPPCFGPGDAPGYRNFYNDPAIPAEQPGVKSQAECFQKSLRMLMILSLDARQYDSISLVQRRLPSKLKEQADFANAAIANSLILVDEDKQTFSVCQTKTKTTFQLVAFAHKPSPPSQQRCKDKIKSDDVPAEVDAVPASPEYAEVAIPELWKGGSSQPMRLAMRSPEGMIYYLGQDVRAMASPDLNQQSRTAERFRPGTDASGKWRTVPLFSVKQGAPESGSAVSVKFDGKTWYVPPINDTEYPDHRSLDVLGLINLTWGMQKKASAPPLTLPVTVIGK